MADTTTELEVLDQIVDVLGGQSGQYETVVPVLEDIRDLLGGGGGGGCYNPALSVGRADALTGADETAQWATRESAGSGAATVRSVQGATEVQNGALVPVQIAGIRSTDAQGGELDAIEWPTQTLRAAGSVADMLYSDHVETRVGVVDLGTLNWESGESISAGFFVARTGGRFINEITCSVYTNRKSLPSWGLWPDMQIAINVSEGSTTTPSGNAGVGSIIIKDLSATGMTAAQFKEHVSGVIAFIGYNAGHITTKPISPALPMTYKVQQGGNENIIVPDGEVSAAPVLTVAEGESAGELVMDALACIATPDGPVATSNHAQNTYLTMGGKLYKVTSAIAVGETITAGTNVTETTVMAELIARTA